MDPIGMLVASLVAAVAMGGVFALQAALRRRRLRSRPLPPLSAPADGSVGKLREPAQWAAFELGASQGRGPIAKDQDAGSHETALDWDGVFRGDPEAEQWSHSDEGIKARRPRR